jgi:hypothetical protein
MDAGVEDSEDAGEELRRAPHARIREYSLFANGD